MPRYQQSFPLYKDIETSLLVAFEAFTHLGWTLEYAGETAIAASPPAVFKTKDFLVVCRAVNGELVVESETLEQSVAKAHAAATAGDTVLLSPACASQDQFRDFEERGDCFRAAVRVATGQLG